jgi:hypothetical protein
MAQAGAETCACRRSDTDHEPEGGWRAVDAMSVDIYHKAGSLPTLALNFFCDGVQYKDWIAVEHDGRARRHAVEKWFRLGGHMPVPDTAIEAMNRRYEFARPRDLEIEVAFDGRFWTVTNARLRMAEDV